MGLDNKLELENGNTGDPLFTMVSFAMIHINNGLETRGPKMSKNCKEFKNVQL
jgi:hypothetical protein